MSLVMRLVCLPHHNSSTFLRILPIFCMMMENNFLRKLTNLKKNYAFGEKGKKSYEVLSNPNDAHTLYDFIWLVDFAVQGGAEP